MPSHLIVQASGAMFALEESIPGQGQPIAGWGFVFAIGVTDEEGSPVAGLAKNNLSVWRLDLATAKIKIRTLTELSVSEPQSQMPGVYRVVTDMILQSPASEPQEYVCVIGVVEADNLKTPRQGVATVAITYLPGLQG